MSEEDQIRFVPSQVDEMGSEAAKRLPFDIAKLSVTGLVIICELDERPRGASRPSMSMKITQYLRLSDDSMLRLDMDRGFSSFKHGNVEAVSWKRTPADVVSEVLTLVKADAPHPGSFPWEEYVQAAKLRGVTTRAEILRVLPCTVLLSDELATTFEF